MLITSLGISGMLMSAYQKSSIEFNVSQEKIKITEEQKNYYDDKINTSKKRIEDLTKIRNSEESRINQILNNEFVSRSPVQLKQLQQQNADMINDTDTSIKEENKKIQDSIDGINKVNELVNNLKLGTSEKKDIQTFKFVADAFNLSLDTVARLIILSIIFVFDPLAVCLILAYNVIVFKKNKETIKETFTQLPTIIKENSNSFKKEEVIKTETPMTASLELKKEIINNNNNVSDFFRQMFKF
jgi:hypothetical protein